MHGEHQGAFFLFVFFGGGPWGQNVSSGAHTETQSGSWNNLTFPSGFERKIWKVEAEHCLCRQTLFPHFLPVLFGSYDSYLFGRTAIVSSLGKKKVAAWNTWRVLQSLLQSRAIRQMTSLSGEIGWFNLKEEKVNCLYSVYYELKRIWFILCEVDFFFHHMRVQHGNKEASQRCTLVTL